jgi:hypothetical protein
VESWAGYSKMGRAARWSFRPGLLLPPLGTFLKSAGAVGVLLLGDLLKIVEHEI